jgi:hypothetical protein
MTLIISKACRNYVLQVTDRLVTRAGKSFDPFANKNIIFCAQNGIVSIAYTGLAFLDEIPTDQWIAEKLMGKSFDRSRKPPALGFGVATKSIYIGPALKMLKEALEDATLKHVKAELRKYWTAKSFDLCIDGYVWNNKGIFRPFLAWISKNPGKNIFTYGCPPRHCLVGGNFILSAAPQNISQSELENLKKQLIGKSPDEVENLLVQSIREISMRNPSVGQDCMSIFLPPPSVAHIEALRVRYIPARPTDAIISTKTSQHTVGNVSFSPWLVGPNSFASPSIMSGDSTEVGLCLYKVKIESLKGGFPAIFSSQERPKEP